MKRTYLELPDAEFFFLDREILNSAIHIENLKQLIPFKPFMRTGRLVCSIGVPYRYSGQITDSVPFSTYKPIEALMLELNQELGTNFNACLLNWYPSRVVSGIGFHSDNEKELVPNPIVASVSLGNPCTFQLKHKRTGVITDVNLNDGAVFVMGEHSQSQYQHGIPYSFNEQDRISLTFREFQT